MSKTKSKAVEGIDETEYFGDDSPTEVEPSNKLVTLKTAGTVLRPSALAGMVESAAAKANVKRESIDPYRFRLENGLPTPRLRYRVTGRVGNQQLPPVECDAHDPSDAIRRAMSEAWKVKFAHRHRVIARTVVLGE